MADEGSDDTSKKDDILEDSNVDSKADSKADSKVPDETKYDDVDDKNSITITTTKNALITTQLGPCDAYPHSVKISIVGARKVGMACAIAILMRRIASEVCLIDQNSDKASAEAEDIQHAGIFLGCPLVVGTSDIYKVKDSTVVVIAVCEKKLEEEVNVKHNIEVFKKIIPTIAKLACKAVLLIVTQPIDVMSYITWKLSKFPSSRVLGTGTLLDSCRFQDLLSRKLGLARTSINCMSIGAQGDTSVSIWSSVHVAGTKIRDINPQMGEADDPEKWRDISEAVNKTDTELNRKKGEGGPNCWALGFCTAEIIDAIVRNTKVVLPVSTYIQSCAHGTDKDMYMSVPCVLGREGVYATVRQKLNEQEKTAIQRCADSIRNVLRECGILRESSDTEEYPCIADMTETRKKLPEVASNTVTVLLAKQAEHLVDGHRVKVVVVGSAPKGVAVAIAILFKIASMRSSQSTKIRSLQFAVYLVNLPKFFTTVACQTSYFLLFSQRLASELVLIDVNEDLAKAEAEDISHAAAYLGNPRIVGTKGEARWEEAAEK
ncbi:LDHA dehydrogenase, partial [Pseudoatta argentina]